MTVFNIKVQLHYSACPLRTTVREINIYKPKSKAAKQACCNVDSFITPPPTAPPLSALSRGRGGHCVLAQFTDLSTVNSLL